jgi:hypothetical protein
VVVGDPAKATDDAICVPVIVALVMSAATIKPLVTACVLPAKWAMPTPGEEDVTHDAHAMVPVLVIVPPVMGEVVATLVTVPPPPLAAVQLARIFVPSDFNVTVSLAVKVSVVPEIYVEQLPPSAIVVPLAVHVPPLEVVTVKSTKALAAGVVLVAEPVAK